MTPPQRQSPIFILGMLQRTGTNHLWDLLGLHPDTELLRPVFEDHLVRWSPHLVSFVDDVSRRWSEDWEVDPSERDELLRSLGDGVVAWIADHAPERRVVTKMPSVEQVGNFFEIFPDCPLIVLVRDGRSVCESGVNSFRWSYERAYRRWRNAADQVIALSVQHAGRPGFLVVRYEELVGDPRAVMRAVCTATGLDPERFPYDEVESAPVLGSSVLRSSQSAVDWKPIDRPEAFDPRERWRSWDGHRHRRFAAVAGVQQRSLGYDLIEPGGRDTLAERWSVLRELVSDAYRRELRLRAVRTIRAIQRTPKAI